MRNALVVALFAASAVAQSGPGEFNPRKVLDSVRPITDATFLKGSEVDGQVTAEELVLGVVIKGSARAYPINMLTGPQREIINDQLGSVAIAATW